MRKMLIGLMLWLFSSNYAYAVEPDFFVKFSACKIVAGYLVLSDESLKIFDGDPSAMACSRAASKISCSYSFNDGKQAKAVDYEITIDSPPTLHFSTTNGSEYIAINTSQHAATIITRIVNLKFAGAKVCQGGYATIFELENLESE